MFDFKIKSFFETVDKQEIEAEYSVRGESYDATKQLLSLWS
jgi:hypothetical protein